MPFPFFWLGALAAGLLLAAVLAAFWLAVHLLARATSEVRGPVLPDLISGFRGWATDHGPEPPPPSSPQPPAAPPPFEEIPVLNGPSPRRVHARVH